MASNFVELQILGCWCGFLSVVNMEFTFNYLSRYGVLSLGKAWHYQKTLIPLVSVSHTYFSVVDAVNWNPRIISRILLMKQLKTIA